MLYNHLKIALRHLRKGQLTTWINLSGLTLGLGSILLISLFIQQELTYDRFHQKLDRLYVYAESNEYTQSVARALPKLLEDYPEVETGTRWFTWYDGWLENGEKSSYAALQHVDSTFFDVFSFPLLYGQARYALTDPQSVVLSQEVAQELFGEGDPTGESVQFGEESYLVTGVLAPIPKQSSLQPEVLMSINKLFEEEDFAQMANWYNTLQETYILLKNPSQKIALEAKFPYFSERYYPTEAQGRPLHLLPFSEYYSLMTGNAVLLKALGLVMLFLLLVVGVNFVNLNLATSLKRQSELAVRKVVGAGQWSIFRQFQTETGLLSGIAVLFSLGTLPLWLPQLNEWWGMDLTFSWAEQGDFAFLVALVTVIFTTLAGTYPAWKLFRSANASVLYGNTTSAPRKRGLRKVLIVAQFAITLILVVASLGIARQINYMKTADLGFSDENVLLADLELEFDEGEKAWSRVKDILRQLEQRTDVDNYTLSYVFPGQYWQNFNNFLLEGSEQEVRLRQVNVASDYFSTYEIPVVNGRSFSTEIASDTLFKIVINEAAQQAFGISDNPIGQQLLSKGTTKKFEVIGVVADYHYQSLEGEVEPLIHYYNGAKEELADGYLAVRTTAGKSQEIMAFLSDAIGRIPARRTLEINYLDETFAEQYADAERSLSLLRFFALLVVVLACAGLFGLSAISIAARTKEVGIRKVLGASFGQITSLLSSRYLLLVGVSMLLALPLAWFLTDQWLQNFAYRIDLSFWIVLRGGLILLAITAMTVGWHSVRAALHNPVDSLRNN